MIRSFLLQPNFNINTSLVHLLRYRHLEKHGIPTVLQTDILAPSFQVPLFPCGNLTRQYLLVALCLINETLFQDVVFQLKFLIESSRLKESRFVIRENFLHFSIVIDESKFFAAALSDGVFEGLSNFKVEAFKKFYIVFVLVEQVLIGLFKFLDQLWISILILLQSSNQRFMLPFYFRQFANYFLNVLFCLFSSQISLIYEVTKGPKRSLTWLLTVNFKKGCPILVILEILDSDYDCLQMKVFSFQATLLGLSPYVFRSQIAADIFFILVIYRFASFTFDLISFSLPTLLLRALEYFSFQCS